jgi:hypothetical protein
MHYTSYLTYELAQEAKVLHYTWLKRNAMEKHSSLFGHFVSHKENEVFCTWPRVVHYTSYLTYEWLKKLECCIRLGSKGLPLTNTLAYRANLKVTKKMKYCEYGPESYSLHFMFNL